MAAGYRLIQQDGILQFIHLLEIIFWHQTSSIKAKKKSILNFVLYMR